MATEFEWDQSKASSNFLKHGVTFEEAVSVFADPLAVIFDDYGHSEEESREIIVGTLLSIGSYSYASSSARAWSASSAPVPRR
jgi:hypothetical protein